MTMNDQPPYDPRRTEALALAALTELHRIGAVAGASVGPQGPQGDRGPQGDQGPQGYQGRNGWNGESVWLTRTDPAPGGGIYQGRAPYAPVAHWGEAPESNPGWTVERIVGDALGRPVVEVADAADGTATWTARGTYRYTYSVLATVALRSRVKRLVRTDPAVLAAAMLDGEPPSIVDGIGIDWLAALLTRHPEIIDEWCDAGTDAYSRAVMSAVRADAS
jgi:hypothetical protein